MYPVIRHNMLPYIHSADSPSAKIKQLLVKLAILNVIECLLLPDCNAGYIESGTIIKPQIKSANAKDKR